MCVCGQSRRRHHYDIARLSVMTLRASRRQYPKSMPRKWRRRNLPPCQRSRTWPMPAPWGRHAARLRKLSAKSTDYHSMSRRSLTPAPFMLSHHPNCPDIHYTSGRSSNWKIVTSADDCRRCSSRRANASCRRRAAAAAVAAESEKLCLGRQFEKLIDANMKR